MTYRKLLELYKSGELDDKQKEKVKNDIERQEAISNYLFSEGDIPRLDDLESNDSILVSPESGFTEDQEDEAYKFTKMVNKKIRRAFIKMGAVIGVIILAIVMFVIFALPKLADSLYYDPSEIAGTNGELETNRISVDLATYSEINLPQSYRDQVLVEGNGYGEYDINILQNASYNGVFTNVAGKVKRGKMTLYDPNLLKRPPVDVFVKVMYDEDTKSYSLASSYTYDDVVDEIQHLDDEDMYFAYVTLNEVAKYSKFVDWCNENNLDPDWCTIQDGGVKLPVGTWLGFNFSSSCSEMEYDKDTYPYLSSFDVGLAAQEGQNQFASEDVMTTHVASIYNYMANQTTFNEMIESHISSEIYSQIADNVKRNGLNIYGFTMVAKKSTLLKLIETGDVAYVYTQPIK